MSITRVVIENYRAIKRVDFNLGASCVFVGENNSGKSTIVRAIDLVLGDRYPNERDFDERDFHDGDTTDPIKIQVFLDEPWVETRRGGTAKVAGFELTCKQYKRATADHVAGELGVDFVCIGPRGGRVADPSFPYRQGQPPPPPLRVTNMMRRRAPLLYIDVMREYARQRPSSRWSVLRRMIDFVHATFAADKKAIAVTAADGSQSMMTRQDAFQYHTEQAFDALRTDELANLEKLLGDNAIQQMGLESGTDAVSLGFASHDPVNAFKNLELLVTQLGTVSRAEDVGAGLQSAIVVAIFRTYAALQREGAIFAIEEPEAFLHPHKARYFASVLDAVVDHGNQVLLTTHSPYFVKLHAPETVAAVRRTADDGSKVVQTAPSVIAPSLRVALRIQASMHADRTEMLFSRRVLFVEGEVERVAMPAICDALKVDPNEVGLSVVDCGGKGSIPLYARIADAFDIPFVVLADLDPTKDQRQTEALKEVCKPENLFLLDPDFEGVCGYVPNDKLVDAYQHFSSKQREDIPPAITDAVDRVASL